MRSFAESRPINVRGHVVKYFHLAGTVEVHLETDGEKGYIQINSLEMLETMPGVKDAEYWTGTYY